MTESSNNLTGKVVQLDFFEHALGVSDGSTGGDMVSENAPTLPLWLGEAVRFNVDATELMMLAEGAADDGHVSIQRNAGHVFIGLHLLKSTCLETERVTGFASFKAEVAKLRAAVEAHGAEPEPDDEWGYAEGDEEEGASPTR